RDHRDEKLLTLAEGFRNGALTHLGAGAKTNAGYGVFRADSTKDPLVAPDEHRTAVFELELVTAGFFAGSSQDGTDCDLRRAPLRGLLRSWWRTMHSAHLSPKQLQIRETALWGNARQGGSIALRLEAVTKEPPLVEFKRRALLGNNDGKRQEIEYRQKLGRDLPSR